MVSMIPPAMLHGTPQERPIPRPMKPMLHKAAFTQVFCAIQMDLV